MSDPYLQRITADMDTWLILERFFCKCEDVCDCGWDDLEADNQWSKG